MAHLSISLLGGFAVTVDGEPVASFESNKVRALLAYLATETDRAHSREKLASLLWPDMPDQAARSNLRYALSNLRKTIGDLHSSKPFLCVSGQTIQIDLEKDVEVDVLTFQQRLCQSPLTLSGLEEAARLYRGDFLEGFSIGDDMAFDEWCMLKREHLQRQALRALRYLAQAYEKNGDVSGALPFAWRRVELESWSEEAHRYLMYLLALSGQRSEALAQYEVCQRALAKELDVEPSIETTQLYERIRDGGISPLPRIPATTQPRTEYPPHRQIDPPTAEAKTERPKAPAVPHPRLKIAAGSALILALFLVIVFLATRPAVPKPAIATAKGKIITPCQRQSAPRICVVDAQTGYLTPLTDDLPLDRFGPGMSWGPGGNQIAFSAASQPTQGTAEDLDLYTITVDGSNLKQVTTGDAVDILPAWSPDGTWIAFHRQCNLWIVQPDGTEAQPLSAGVCATGIAWSPDSRWIAFIDTDHGPDSQRPGTIRIFQPSGNNSRIVYTFSPPVRGGRLAWSADGQQIFAEYENDNHLIETLLIDLSGQVVKQGAEIPTNWFQDFWPQWRDEE
ncbi:Dipeptidyl-peptidase 5 [Thermoflexales bacterium]|nr:Dipeptidyl-peptidase 5 [Thermoflexales bacterium]